MRKIVSMDKSSYYFLAFLIVLAPHFWPGVALFLALIFGAHALFFAVQDIRRHMRDAERERH